MSESRGKGSRSGRTETDEPAIAEDAVGSETLSNEEIAKHLREAGGRVHLEIWPRVPHGWPIFLGWLRAADEAAEKSGQFIAERMAAAEEAALRPPAPPRHRRASAARQKKTRRKT